MNRNRVDASAVDRTGLPPADVPLIEIPPTDQKLTILASAIAASLCVLWGANAVAIKFSLSGLGPFPAAAVRFGISTLFLWAWVKMTGRSSVGSRKDSRFMNLKNRKIMPQQSRLSTERRIQESKKLFGR